LQHAHQRGVLHRDVKPSNILLGSDGQPMLLDFNLAQSDSSEQAHASLGGTVAYMSPEHLRALAARDPALARAVDQRSDVYALGMVLFEVLAGRSPFDQSASYTPLPVLIEAMALERGRTVPSLRAVRPDVPWSLESILRRCLAPNPDQRYQQAEDLAEDLRRFLDDQPLRHAPELSQVERLRKWARRHPRVTSAAPICATAALLLLGAGLALATVGSSLTETRRDLDEVHAQDRKRSFEKGAARALFLVNTTHELEDHLRQGRTVCEETLGLYGVLDRPDWERHPDWVRLAADDRVRLAADARELVLLLAGARVRLAPDDRDTLKDALALLDLAEAIAGLPPCRALWEDRAAYREQLGDATGAKQARTRARDVEPHSARDFYLLAMTCARDGRYSPAIGYLDEALRRDPRHYWSWVQRGLCHQGKGDPVLAAADFGVCVGLEPGFAWGHFNRAYALAQSGRKAEAIADYGSALRCDPELLPAYLNRGLLRLEAGDAAAALTDFQHLLDRGRDDAAFHSWRGVALERLGRPNEADVAFEAARARAAGGPVALRARLLCVHGFAVAGRAPDKARSAFDAALAAERDNPQALYGRAMLLEREQKWDEALASYNRALVVSPDFVEARRFRAVLLARLKRFPEAEKEVREVLRREPDSGAARYAAACVSALASRQNASEADRAIELLRQAFALNYGRDKVVGDRDLDPVRDHPGFPK
jgi:tetratricopeptide (TPR) repeat protein